MFSKACEKAMKFTRPVIASTRAQNGTTTSSVASFIIINREGWAITAGHIFDGFLKFKDDQKKIEEYKKTKESDPSSTIQMDPNWLTNQSFWWGYDSLRIGKVYVNGELDLALVKLEGFKPEMVPEYPIFKDPSTIRPGTSICRIGFPFVENLTVFEEDKQMFRIRSGALPVPFFPNDGIVTRLLTSGKTKDDYEKLFVETSTPGLKGQSGGPIFDTNGYVMAMQSRTLHMNLGFKPVTKNEAGETITTEQYFNIGIGLNVSTIMKVLDANNVRYSKETDDKGFRIMD